MGKCFPGRGNMEYETPEAQNKNSSGWSRGSEQRGRQEEGAAGEAGGAGSRRAKEGAPILL